MNATATYRYVPMSEPYLKAVNKFKNVNSYLIAADLVRENLIKRTLCLICYIKQRYHLSHCKCFTFCINYICILFTNTISYVRITMNKSGHNDSELFLWSVYYRD